MPESKNAINLDALGHGWEWFKYHADQRMTLLRYYFLTVGATATAYLGAMHYELYLAAIGASIFGATACWGFHLLDQRTGSLIKLGENVLSREQMKFQDQLGYDDILIIEKANRHTRKYLGSYRRILRLMFVVSGMMFVGGAFVSLYMLVGSCNLATDKTAEPSGADPTHSA